ncbi:ABC transporter substrate-binding protein [Microvirga thermotolerans]|uniref:ABC transporter substrate-binding protein n=1 Tax=Microvirga thermotolerans TaxID=2651334 RepID=A0A5P9JSA5_9HYPH|nr:ABC transporter substrate-binding protein [Microvirga thermotolerans]QFU15507.1 ABC transporter substrate-binding protein [Microvirga thermotolerans]
MPQLRPGEISRSIALALLTWLAGAAGAAAQAPQRVVSLNLCADELLLALADREQIASVSPLARDPAISFLWREAAGLAANDGRGESILFGDADLVLAGSFDRQSRTALLRRQGLDVLLLSPWRSFAEGRAEIETVARRLGHPERGEALVEAIDAALARTRGLVPAGRSILVYQRRGWVPASDSLIGELLRHMGFVLHQDALGLGGGGVARLETLVRSPPDYLLMDEDAALTVDNGSALLNHPALAEAVPPSRRLVIPGRLAICGGPSTPALIDALGAEVRAKVR